MLRGPLASSPDLPTERISRPWSTLGRAQCLHGDEDELRLRQLRWRPAREHSIVPAWHSGGGSKALHALCMKRMPALLATSTYTNDEAAKHGSQPQLGLHMERWGADLLLTSWRGPRRTESTCEVRAAQGMQAKQTSYAIRGGCAVCRSLESTKGTMVGHKQRKRRPHRAGSLGRRARARNGNNALQEDEENAANFFLEHASLSAKCSSLSARINGGQHVTRERTPECCSHTGGLDRTAWHQGHCMAETMVNATRSHLLGVSILLGSGLSLCLRWDSVPDVRAGH
eukprot:scaffold191290_cov39-Tisochrysis_lutea.AAC.2